MPCRNYSAQLGWAVGATLGLGVRAIRTRGRAKSGHLNAGVTLYDSVWNAVSKLFFNREQLADFGSWRHRFDTNITCLAEGERYANQLVASLGDRYTRLRTPDETQFDTESQLDKVCHAEHIGGGIAMIVFQSFDAANAAEQLAECFESVRGCSRFILDMRTNGGGWVDEALRCCSLFLDEGRLGSASSYELNGRRRRVSFELSESGIMRVDLGKPNKVVSRLPRLANVFGGKPVVAMVSERTASASEVMLGCLASHGLLTLVGETTRGKGIEQAQVPLADGYLLSVTRGRWYLPDGRWLGDAGMTCTSGLQPHYPCEAEQAVPVAVNLLR